MIDGCMPSAKGAHHPLLGSGMIWAINGPNVELHLSYNYICKQNAMAIGLNYRAHGQSQAMLVPGTELLPMTLLISVPNAVAGCHLLLLSAMTWASSRSKIEVYHLYNCTCKLNAMVNNSTNFSHG